MTPPAHNQKEINADTNLQPEANEEPPSTFARYKEKVRTAVIAGGLGILGYGVTILWVTPFKLLYTVPGISPTYSGEMLMSQIALFLGVVMFGAFYLHYTDRGWDYIDINGLSRREMLLIIGGTAVVLFGLYGVSILTDLFQTGSSQHSIQQTAATAYIDPRFFGVMIPISFLVIGPAEEFLFRNIVQKRLYESFTKPSAILISSTVFAMVHFPAYNTGPLPEILVSLSTVFFLSIAFGTAYAWTGNLMVPAALHGAYNAVIFARIYSQLGGSLGFQSPVLTNQL